MKNLRTARWNLEIGIGVRVGTVILGKMGLVSPVQNRHEDSVNIASGLEQLTKSIRVK